jgi:putative molybdopterin biosynthesis protein
VQKIQPLDRLPVHEALARLQAALVRAGWAPGTESVPTYEALGRVTAEPVRARIAVPHYRAAAVDGVAVRSALVERATPDQPVRLTLPDQAQWVDTGEPIPAEADAVIMKEELTWVEGGRAVQVARPIHPGRHVRAVGEDWQAGREVLQAGVRIRPVDIAALLATGIAQVQVYHRPIVGFLPTGSELVEADARSVTSLRPGQILESNSHMILAEVARWGGQPLRHPIVPDDPARLRAAIADLIERCDLLLISAGSSQGSRDFTVHLLRELGEVLVHGVAMRPGKPVILAMVKGKPVIGLPGYPGAAWLAAYLFVRPLLYQAQGQEAPPAQRVTARLGAPIRSPAGLAHYVRIRLRQALVEPGQVQSGAPGWIAAPFPPGSGLIATLVGANGLLCIPPGVTELPAGALVEVERLI